MKQVIARTCKIPQDKQVLLISGGESLIENTRVASYSAGTDTNPIFLFSKNVIESAIPPPASVDYDSGLTLNISRYRVSKAPERVSHPDVLGMERHGNE